MLAAACGGDGSSGADAGNPNVDGGGGGPDAGNTGASFYSLDYDRNFRALDGDLQEISMTSVGAPDGYEPIQLIHADGRFVAVFDGLGYPNKVYTSSDGSSWSELTIDAQVMGVSNVAYGNGRWVLGAASGITYSDDLSEYTVIPDTGQNFGWAVSYFPDVGGGTFTATYSDPFVESMRYSTDGATWNGTALTSSQSALYGLRSVDGNLVGISGTRQIARSTDGGASFTDTTTLAGNAYSRLGQGMGLLVAVGSSAVGTSYAQYSTDGGQSFLDGSLGAAEPGPGNTLFDSSANRFVHVDDKFDGFYASTDGMTWTATGLSAHGRASTIIAAP